MHVCQSKGVSNCIEFKNMMHFLPGSTPSRRVPSIARVSPEESPDERALREKLQREASMISHAIDEDIQEARKAFERRKKAIKILLLGELFLHILLLPYPTPLHNLHNPLPPIRSSLWTLVLLPPWIFRQERCVADMWRSRSGRVRQEHYAQE